MKSVLSAWEPEDFSETVDPSSETAEVPESPKSPCPSYADHVAALRSDEACPTT